MFQVYSTAGTRVGSSEQHVITAITILSSCPSGNWSQKPIEIGSKTTGGSTAAASGSHSRKEDAAWEVNRACVWAPQHVQHSAGLTKMFTVSDIWRQLGNNLSPEYNRRELQSHVFGHRSFPVCMFQISDRVWSLVQSGVRAERVHRPVYSAEVKDATEMSGSVQHVRPCFQSACSFFSGWCCPWRTTLAFLKQSQSSSSIQETLLLTSSLWREWVRLSVESLNTFGSVKFTSHRISQHATPMLKKMELFIQRNIIYTIYTKGLLCISSLLLFISIEILHVHVPVNTGLQDGLKHDPPFWSSVC